MSEGAHPGLPFDCEPVDPGAYLAGPLLLTVPHQDDGVLACGATLARLPDPASVHVVYATDGAASPEPPPGTPPPEGLVEIRRDEARAAMASLGVPETQVHFLDLPDGGLRGHGAELRRGLRDLAARVRPSRVLAPFRYDRHADHLALNAAVTDLRAAGELGDATLDEYFVYHASRLLPKGDIRAYVRPGLLRRVDPAGASAAKRAALDRFASQTTRFYPWQTRPNLTPALLDAVSAAPEVFLRYDPDVDGAAVLAGPVTWIRVAHRIEPWLKKRKDRSVARLRRMLGRPAP